MSEEPVRIYYDSSRVVVGSWENVLVLLSRGTITTDDVAAAQSAAQGFEKAMAGNYVLLSIAKASAPLPSPETRKASAEMMKILNPAATALVLDGKGFRAAAVRATATGVFVAANIIYNAKLQMFGTTSEASRWLADKMDTRSWSPDRLTEILKTFGGPEKEGAEA